jgi:two-component system, NtrC family, nitrogen regulation sensor histidine kinase NtrY
VSKPDPASHRVKPGVATESRLFWRALSVLIPVGALLYMLWAAPPLTTPVKIAISAGAVIWIIVAALSIRRTFVHQMRTLNTLIEAIRSEDYSLRGTIARETGDLAELFQQINSLTDELQQTRQDSKELRGLLERIITQFNVAVVAYDGNDRIVLANHLTEKLLQVESSVMIGKPIKFYQLDRILPAQNSHLLEYAFPGARGRWQVSRQTYIHNGKQGNLLFIADLEQVLSEQEIKAWQRLIRVVAHEVNNSLTPIMSLCQTLSSILGKQAANGDVPQQDGLLEGLEVISERARNLKNFISDYARIAHLPDAQKKQFDLLVSIGRILTIYREERIEFVTTETAVLVFGDQTQIEQVLINLIKNAIEANADKTKTIVISVACNESSCKVNVSDEGSGISNQANLFVPFYTTKPQGAGIGLALARRIVAAHNGDLQLQNREDAAGAIATLTLPLSLERSKEQLP